MTDTSTEDSRSSKQQKQRGGRQKGRDETNTTADTSVIDLKMQLALEMSKFIEEIEYQLEHVVPMAELCFVGDIVGCFESRKLWMHRHVVY